MTVFFVLFLITVTGVVPVVVSVCLCSLLPLPQGGPGNIKQYLGLLLNTNLNFLNMQAACNNLKIFNGTLLLLCIRAGNITFYYLFCRYNPILFPFFEYYFFKY